MANTYFRIKKSSVAGTPAEPPFDAWPVGLAPNGVDAPPVVNYPQATAVAINGAPTGAFGKPWTEFGRPRIGAAGMAYYNALFAATTSGSALVKVNLLDPRAGAWAIYSGIAWRPTIAQRVLPSPSGSEYTDFRLRVTELVTLGSWD
jgi:hypothetical protein